MKKILSATVAMGLVVGFAATASALDLTTKGSYNVTGAMQSDGFGAGNGVDLTEGIPGAANKVEQGNDAFYFHSFITDSTLKVNDNVSMFGQLRFADRDYWGVAAEGNTNNNSDLAQSGGRQLDIRQIYMEYISPIGKLRVGRTPAAAWYGKFLDSIAQSNRIIYYPNFIPEPFSVFVLTQKSAEADATTAFGTKGESDADTDNYMINVEHKSSLGTTALAWWQTRTANATALPAASNVVESLDTSDIWAYGKYTISNFTIEAELDYAFGDVRSSTAGSISRDLDALGASIDVDSKWGNLNVGGLYFYMSGQDRISSATPGTTDVEAMMAYRDGTGDDFNPFLILTGDFTGILNTDRADRIAATYARTGDADGDGFDAADDTLNDIDQAGVHAFGLKAGYQVTPKLNISGVIGTAFADEEQYATQDDSYGIEYDLNLSYKLLDNLTYSAHFGYLNTGDFFEYNTVTGLNNVTTNDITFVANALSMNF